MLVRKFMVCVECCCNIGCLWPVQSINFHIIGKIGTLVRKLMVCVECCCNIAVYAPYKA